MFSCDVKKLEISTYETQGKTCINANVNFGDPKKSMGVLLEITSIVFQTLTFFLQNPIRKDVFPVGS